MQEKARRIVMDYFNAHVDKTDQKQITMDDDEINIFGVMADESIT